jgi:hypothetical protein
MLVGTPGNYPACPCIKTALYLISMKKPVLLKVPKIVNLSRGDNLASWYFHALMTLNIKRKRKWGIVTPTWNQTISYHKSIEHRHHEKTQPAWLMDQVLKNMKLIFPCLNKTQNIKIKIKKFHWVHLFITWGIVIPDCNHTISHHKSIEDPHLEKT